MHTVRSAFTCIESEFAGRAVLAVLGRDPSMYEMLDIHEQRAAGTPRAAIIRGLLRIAANENRPAPDDWALALPRRIDVAHLLAPGKSTPVFIREAYETMLGRPPAPSEVLQQSRFLRWPRTRSDFLAALASSAEVQAVGGEISLSGLGRRGPSLARFIARFRSNQAQSPTAETLLGRDPDALRDTVGAAAIGRQMLVNDPTPALVETLRATSDRMVENLHARGEQLSSLSRQLATIETTLGRLRVRIETDAAMTSEIACDTKVTQELLREIRGAMESLLRSCEEQARLLPDMSAHLSKSVADVARCSDEILDIVRLLRPESPAQRTEDVVSVLGQSLSGVGQIVQSLEGLPRDLAHLIETTTSLASSVGRTEAACADAGARILPPIIPGGDVVVTQVDGFFLGVPKREWRLSTYYHNRGPLEPGVYKLLCGLLRPGMTFVDVGASVGLYTLLAARHIQARGAVFSFEPTPQIFDILTNNVQLNGFAESGVVRLHKAAVAGEVCPGRLYTDMRDSTQNSLFPSAGKTESVPVDCLSLDHVLVGHGPADVVKIDAEGAEPLIIRGMRGVIANRDVQIIMEFAPTLLERAGFEPAGFLGELRSAGMTARQVDDLSGELRTASDELLLSMKSANVLLTRR